MDRVALAVENFLTDLVDDDRTTCTFEEVELLGLDLQIYTTVLIREIRSYGVEVTREIPKNVRGYRTSSHDRYFGPGSSSSYGGSGYEQITGFGGKQG